MRVTGEWKDRLTDELATYQPDQLVRAMQLVKSGRISRHMNDFVCTGSDGLSLYRVSAYRQSCSCPAGTYNVHCYHLAAATALAVYGKDEMPPL